MKKRFVVIFALVILVLLGYVLKDIDFYEVYSLLQKIDHFYFALAFLSCLVSFLLWNLRWKNTLRGIVNADYFFLLKVLFAGVFFNNITPGTGIGGEPVRAYFLSKKYKQSKTKILGSILADKMFNLSVFLLFVVLSLLFILVFADIPGGLKILFEIGLFVIFILITIFLIIPNKEKFKGWILKKSFSFKSVRGNFRNFKEFEKYVNKRISNLKNSFKKSLKGKNKFYRGFLLSLGVWMSTYLVSYFLFLSFDAKINLLPIIIVITLSTLIGDISPIPGGMGLMESSMFLLYSSMGIPGPLAVVVTLLSRFIYYFFSLFIGGISVVYLKFSVK